MRGTLLSIAALVLALSVAHSASLATLRADLLVESKLERASAAVAGGTSNAVELGRLGLEEDLRTTAAVHGDGAESLFSADSADSKSDSSDNGKNLSPEAQKMIKAKPVWWKAKDDSHLGPPPLNSNLPDAHVSFKPDRPKQGYPWYPYIWSHNTHVQGSVSYSNIGDGSQAQAMPFVVPHEYVVNVKPKF